MATEFTRIKQAVEEQKTKKMRGEARKSSLVEEQQRLHEEASKESGKTIDSTETLQKVSEEVKTGIESNIQKMKEILDEEGVDY